MFGVMVLVAVVLNLIGIVSLMGGAMSDAPTEGERAARAGAIMIGISIALGVATGILRFKGIV